jgi:hypothetical protein
MRRARGLKKKKLNATFCSVERDIKLPLGTPQNDESEMLKLHRTQNRINSPSHPSIHPYSPIHLPTDPKPAPDTSANKPPSSSTTPHDPPPPAPYRRP